MNYFGSYRRLLENSKSALVAAIEIYNKPSFQYRDEVFVILLLNAWELLLKAVLSKNRRSIYYRKRRGEPYRTLSWAHALARARTEKVWPAEVDPRPVEANLQHLSVYRDAAVHFYNAPRFGVVIHSLAQTAIMNYRDVLRLVFGQELAQEFNWHLLPLGIEPALDPVKYLRGSRPQQGGGAVDEFLASLVDAVDELNLAGSDTGRLMTLYQVSLQSTKKIERADVIIGVEGGGGDNADRVFVERRIDPVKSHPLFMKDVLDKVKDVDLNGRNFNQYDFQAVVHHYGLRNRPEYCYEDPERVYVRWSGELPKFIRRLKPEDIEFARSAYRAHLRSRRETTRP